MLEKQIEQLVGSFSRRERTAAIPTDRRGPYLFKLLLEEDVLSVQTTHLAGPPPDPAPATGRTRLTPAQRRLSGIRAMVSVMISDGELGTSERAFIDRILESSGLEPLSPGEIRRWKPTELPRPPDAEEVVRSLVALVMLDGRQDRTEWRLVREFARSWRVPDSRMDRFRRELAQADRLEPVRHFLRSLIRLFSPPEET